MAAANRGRSQPRRLTPSRRVVVSTTALGLVPGALVVYRMCVPGAGFEPALPALKEQGDDGCPSAFGINPRLERSHRLLVALGWLPWL